MGARNIMKHNIYLLLMGGAMLLALNSCSAFGGKSDAYFPFKSSADGKWGMVSSNGEVLFEEEFKHEPTMVFNDRFIVENSEGIKEIYTATAKPEKVGEEYIGVLSFYEDVTPAVKKNECIKLIDTKGQVKATLDKVDGKNVERCSRFSFGRAIIETDEGLYGVIDTKGKVVLKPKYEKVKILSSKYFLVVDHKNHNKESDTNPAVLVDNKGNAVNGLKFGKGQKYVEIDANASDADNGLLVVAIEVDDERQWGIINLDKEVVVKPSSKIREITQIFDDKYIYYDGENYGVRSLKGDVVLRPKYESLWYIDDGLFVMRDDNDKCYLINMEGNKITDEPYIFIAPFRYLNNLPVRIADHSYGFINRKGKEITSKNMPDIYALHANVGNEWVESDFVDIDAIVRKLKITKNGLYGYDLSFSPLQMAKAYNEIISQSDRLDLNGAQPLSLNPEENRGRDRLSLNIETPQDIRYRSEVYYSGYMVPYGYYSDEVKWSDDKPTTISVTIDQGKIRGKEDQLFKKLCAQVKNFGQVLKQNQNAMLVKVTDDKGWLVLKAEDQVSIGLINNASYKNTDISPYGDDISTAESAAESYDNDDYAVVDSVAADEILVTE